MRSLLLILLLAGCSGDNRQITVGSRAESMPKAGADAAAAAGNASIVTIDPLPPPPVSPRELTVELVKDGCDGECTVVTVRPRAGNPPYDVSWEDHSTTHKRTLCPAPNAKFTATVRDTAFETPEFSYEARTKTADVPPAMLDCSQQRS